MRSYSLGRDWFCLVDEQIFLCGTEVIAWQQGCKLSDGFVVDQGGRDNREGTAAYFSTGPHKLMKFQRCALGSKDVAIKIHYCGVCHSDIHTIRGDWAKINTRKLLGTR
jgi:hypothetical protein